MNNPEHQALQNRIYYSTALVLCIYKLWLVADLPYVISMTSPHDATWMALKSMHIYAGEWMGEYGDRTLIKGPVFSIFLAAIAKLGIPPKLAVDTLYVIASLFCLKLFTTVSGSRVAGIFAFTLVLFNPVTFSAYWVGALRQHVYLPITIIFLSSLGLILNNFFRHERFGIWNVLICATALALAWNTREESIWMLPALGIALLSILLNISKNLKQLVRLGMTCLVIAATPFLIWHSLASKNQEHYGFYGVVDFKSEQFQRAINGILSLVTIDNESNHHLTQESKEKLLQISESTRELITPLLDEQLNHYTHYGASISATTAAWAIRDSMAFNGYYASFTSAEGQYKKIADDIEAYCQTNPGSCREQLIFNILWKPSYLEKVPESIWNNVQLLTRFELFDPNIKFPDHYAGDLNWQYAMSRMYNYNAFERIKASDENLSALTKNQKAAHQARMQIYKWYHHAIQILSILGFIWLLLGFFFMAWRSSLPWITLIFLSGLASTFFIYIIVSITAVTVHRLLVTSTGPLLLLIGLFLSVSISYLLGKLPIPHLFGMTRRK